MPHSLRSTAGPPPPSGPARGPVRWAAASLALALIACSGEKGATERPANTSAAAARPASPDAARLTPAALTSGGEGAVHAPGTPGRVSVVVLGDLPYDTVAERRWDEVSRAVRGADADVVIHVGDYKAGADPCTGALARQRREQFLALGARVAYVPGDNEWTDCSPRRKKGLNDRERDAHAFDELDKLRRVFWNGGARSFGTEGFPVERPAGPHAAFTEHQRWRIGDVAFVALNVPGVSDPKRARRLAHVLPAVRSWLLDGVRWAEGSGAHVLVVAMQANPVQASFLAENMELRALLREAAIRFPGRIVLVHGDTHCYAVQEPLWEDRPNLMRVETDGAPRVGYTAVEITTGRTAADARVEVQDHPLFRDSGRQPCPERARGRRPPLPAEG